MPSTAARNSSTVANDNAVGNTAWTNPTNAQGSTDGTTATSSVTGTNTTQRLKATNFGFTSTTVPNNATITGIQVQVRTTAGTANRAYTSELFVVKGGTTQTGATNLGEGSGSKWANSQQTRTYGGDGELFGLSWTPTDIQSSGFGVSLRAAGSNTSTTAVAWFAITIFYTVPTTTSVGEISLASANTPTTQTNHSIKLRARKTGTGTVLFNVALYEGTTNRSGDLTTSALTTSLADYTLNISDANAANITSYANLGIRFWATSADGDTGNVELADIYLQVPAGAGGTTTPKSISGAFSFTGSVQKLTRKTQTGAITFTGSKQTATKKVVNAVALFTGNIAKSTRRQISGAFTFVGRLVRRSTRSVAGSITFAGNTAIAKVFKRAFIGAISYAGNTVAYKTVARAFIGAINASGSLVTKSVFVKAFSGVLSATGSLITNSKFTEALSGALSQTGDITRRVNKSITGAFSFPTSLLSNNALKRALTATLSFAGDVNNSVQKNFSAAIAFSAVIRTRTKKVLQAGIDYVGNIFVKSDFAVHIQAALSFTGDISSTIGKRFVAAITFNGRVGRLFTETLSGTLTFTGIASKRLTKALSGVLNTASDLVGKSIINQKFTAGLNFAGNLAQSFGKRFTASLSATADLGKSTAKNISGGISFTGRRLTRLTKSFSGQLQSVGTLLERQVTQYTQEESGSINLTGDLAAELNPVSPVRPPVVGQWSPPGFRGKRFVFAGEVQVVKSYKFVFSGQVTVTAPVTFAVFGSTNAVKTTIIKFSGERLPGYLYKQALDEDEFFMEFGEY